MDIRRNITINSISAQDQLFSENTTTFLTGFGILLIFVTIGVLATAFLCMTLKKDPYLWEVVFDPHSRSGNSPDPNNPNSEATETN